MTVIARIKQLLDRSAPKARLYTVDRSRLLVPRLILTCDSDYTGRKFFPIHGIYDRAELTAFVNGLFPSGLSFHGKQYLLDQSLIVPGSTATSPQPFAPHIPMIELIAELVRRVSFPKRPSRFTSAFAWASLDDANWFRQTYCDPNSSIATVMACPLFRGDMNLLLLGGTILGSWLFATKYWRGESSPQPRWETLVALPCKVEAVNQ